MLAIKALGRLRWQYHIVEDSLGNIARLCLWGRGWGQVQTDTHTHSFTHTHRRMIWSFLSFPVNPEPMS